MQFNVRDFLCSFLDCFISSSNVTVLYLHLFSLIESVCCVIFVIVLFVVSYSDCRAPVRWNRNNDVQTQSVVYCVHCLCDVFVQYLSLCLFLFSKQYFFDVCEKAYVVRNKNEAN